jgi:leader peptidase (prepilin peptidase)/N-methyltransferase
VPLSLFLAVYAALFGLVVGSYLNVVIHRLPRGVSTVLPASSCPSCGAAIRWYDNLPLVSWLALRGRCRVCGAPISWRYPFVEALTSALFVYAWWRHGVSLEAAATATFGCLLLALAMIDAEHYLLPDRLTLPGIVVGLALQPFLAPTVFLGAPGLVPALVGVALGGGLLFALWGGWYLLRGEEGMGLGDVKMLAMIGAFLGWKGVLVCLFVASLSGSLLGLAVIAAGRGGLRSRLPFGTFLAFGGAVAMIWGRALVDAYARLL